MPSLALVLQSLRFPAPMGYASVMPQRRHSASSSSGGRFASGAASAPTQPAVAPGALTLERSDTPSSGSPLSADDYPLICDSL